MNYEEFLSVITLTNPSQEELAKALAYVESADIETLEAALSVSGIHTLFIKMINKSLQEKISAKNTRNSMQSISSKLKKGP